MLTANTSNTLLFICQIDVGGSRSRIQRMNWIRVIQNKDFSILLYFAAVSEYDQLLTTEDGRRNRLEESLLLFKTILHSVYVVQKEVILLMTKTDLLKQKLQDGSTSFKKYFPTTNSSFPR